MKQRVKKQNQALIYRELRDGYYRDRERVEEQGMQSPRYGVMDHPDGYARVTGEHDETIEIFLRIQNRIVTEARFTAGRCLVTRAVCSAAVEWVTGKAINDAMRIDREAVSDRLGNVPRGHEHCIDRAVTAIRKALKNRCTENGKVPCRETMSVQ